MEEMIGYIFNEMQSSRCALESVKKTLRRQKLVNRRLTAILFASTIYAVVVGLQYHEQHRRIEELNDEIEELRDHE